MVDPLAEVVSLLQPGAPFSKLVTSSGAWRVRRTDVGHPFYCAVLEGRCRLSVQGHAPLDLMAGDFVLIPAIDDFEMSSLDPEPPDDLTSRPVNVRPGIFRIGPDDVPHNARSLVGHCVFGSPDADLLVSLLPERVHVRGEARLQTLMQLVGDECREARPARDVVLARLLEVLFIEALRSSAGTAASPGLARGLADERLAAALRQMHAHPTQAWTVAQLAREAALSRSAFFDRFSRAVGVAPMEYLLAWRMAMARKLLRDGAIGVAEVAERVGYGSASTFTVAFTRHVGVSPGRFAREAVVEAVNLQ